MGLFKPSWTLIMKGVDNKLSYGLRFYQFQLFHRKRWKRSSQTPYLCPDIVAFDYGNW